MAIGPSFYKEEYKNLTLDELKRKLKSCESSFKKLRYKFWDLFIRNCDYSNEANNEAQIIAIKELITEKEKNNK